jgi:hypothetical protein
LIVLKNTVPSSRRRPGPTTNFRALSGCRMQDCCDPLAFNDKPNLLMLVVGPGLRRDDACGLLWTNAANMAPSETA